MPHRLKSNVYNKIQCLHNMFVEQNYNQLDKIQ